MKPSELRIGNYCQTNKGYLLQVNELSEKGIDFHLVDREKHPIKETWQAEFIPLTEEWLVSFGFRKDNNGVYWIDLQTHYLELIPSGGYWFPVYVQLAEMSVEDEQRVNLNRIQFAHEIQNLYFALTGEELEITKQ